MPQLKAASIIGEAFRFSQQEAHKLNGFGSFGRTLFPVLDTGNLVSAASRLHVFLPYTRAPRTFFLAAQTSPGTRPRAEQAAI